MKLAAVIALVFVLTFAAHYDATHRARKYRDNPQVVRLRRGYEWTIIVSSIVVITIGVLTRDIGTSVASLKAGGGVVVVGSLSLFMRSRHTLEILVVRGLDDVTLAVLIVLCRMREERDPHVVDILVEFEATLSPTLVKRAGAGVVSLHTKGQADGALSKAAEAVRRIKEAGSPPDVGIAPRQTALNFNLIEWLDTVEEKFEKDNLAVYSQLRADPNAALTVAI